MNGIEKKALAACIEHTKAKDEIRRLTDEIGNHLCGCLGVKGTLCGTKVENGDETHLASVYRGFVSDDYFEPSMSYFTPEQIQTKLDAECKFCLAAHNAVQARKQAKKKLATARRAITKIGRGAA